MRKVLSGFLVLIPILVSCSSGNPPESLFRDNFEKMVLVDRAMDFNEKVTKISILNMTVFEDQVEVEIRVEGWATHRDLVIGATLPVSKNREAGWARWKFFCRKMDKTWVIVEKYKVEEGFVEN